MDHGGLSETSILKELNIAGIFHTRRLKRGHWWRGLLLFEKASSSVGAIN
jgi:hypothetical protein